MNIVNPQKLKLKVDSTTDVSALLLHPQEARACFVFAHGAGAGMTHEFMEQVAAGLCDRGIATLRYQLPYMEKGSRRPDAPAIAHAAVRAAVAEAARCCPGLGLVAGGKSFGGRMTSQAQAIAPLKGVHGLAFLGFPLHPREAVGDTGQAPRRCPNSHAVRAGHARQARGAAAARRRHEAPGSIRVAASGSGGGSFLSRAGALGKER